MERLIGKKVDTEIRLHTDLTMSKSIITKQVKVFQLEKRLLTGLQLLQPGGQLDNG